jgi:hypothetical protein
MDELKAPSERPRKKKPETLDLSERAPDEPATVEDLERLRDEINYKLALLLDLQIDTIQRPHIAKDKLIWHKKIELASDIGYQNFLDFVLWQHAQAREKDPPPSHRPDQGAWA